MVDVSLQERNPESCTALLFCEAARVGAFVVTVEEGVCGVGKVCKGMSVTVHCVPALWLSQCSANPADECTNRCGGMVWSE